MPRAYVKPRGLIKRELQHRYETDIENKRTKTRRKEKMTTCPMCDDIRIVCINEYPHEKAWHMHCNCGWVWANSSYARSKAECKIAWEKQMEERSRAARHNEEARQSRQEHSLY